jgi:thiamine pyrophosphate-dependent acetolactate synthase large subunit-like protein
MGKQKRTPIDRRNFLKSAAVTSVAAMVGGEASAMPTVKVGATPANGTPLMCRPAEIGNPSDAEVLTTDRPGSDFMVDVLKSLGMEYVAANPGSSFRGLHESVINYGQNRSPELITCCHEESAVAIAHGYAKIAGKPMAVFAHSTVGLQHAAMGIFNAYCDRVPVYIVLGNTIDETMRRPGVEWDHSVQDAAAMVRDYIKWDDLPISLTHFAESAVRAYKIAMTPPMMPVLLVADSDLQERPVPSDSSLRIPKLTLAGPPQGDSAAVSEAAKVLAAAENPVIVVDRAARTAEGVLLLIDLAETLQAPVLDLAGRMNFPTLHPLNHSARGRELVSTADVILGLEVTDFWGTVHSYRDQLQRTSQPIIDKNTKLICVTANDLYMKGNYQDVQRYTEVDVAIAADAQATMPSLIEAVKRQLTTDRRRALEDRGKRLSQTHDEIMEQVRVDASYGWDASPISTARLVMELYAQIKDLDWSLVSTSGNTSSWANRLWPMEKHYQWLGGSGGYGIGYGAPASVGAALGNRDLGRFSVSIQSDGDLMFAPGVLWTAARHKIPLLAVMHNNRGYHQESMHVQRFANLRNRVANTGNDLAPIGTSIMNPDIAYHDLAKSMGWWAKGPITDPADLGPAIKEAVAVVKDGQPALVNVMTQPR